jgi:hypothetical protein
MPRLDSSLEAAGAEFLVLGQLLVGGIQAFKAYTNFPGYDIIATDAEHNRSCRIQVKSRWATDSGGGFPIRSFDCDFVVFVALNRGYRYKKAPQTGTAVARAPQFYVFPVAVVQAAQHDASGWGKVFLHHIEAFSQYENAWSRVRNFLDLESSAGEPSSNHHNVPTPNDADHPKITSERFYWKPGDLSIFYDPRTDGPIPPPYPPVNHTDLRKPDPYGDGKS